MYISCIKYYVPVLRIKPGIFRYLFGVLTAAQKKTYRNIFHYFYFHLKIISQVRVIKKCKNKYHFCQRLYRREGPFIERARSAATKRHKTTERHTPTTAPLIANLTPLAIQLNILATAHRRLSHFGNLANIQTQKRKVYNRPLFVADTPFRLRNPLSRPKQGDLL